MAPEGSDSALPRRTSAPVRVDRSGRDFRPDGGFGERQRRHGTPFARPLETIIRGQPAAPPSLLAQLTFAGAPATQRGSARRRRRNRRRRRPRALSRRRAALGGGGLRRRLRTARDRLA